MHWLVILSLRPNQTMGCGVLCRCVFQWMLEGILSRPRYRRVVAWMIWRAGIERVDQGKRFDRTYAH